MISKNGFQTKIWGAPGWLFLHCIAFNYTPEKHKDYERFFRVLATVLPCKTCRDNYTRIITRGRLKLKRSIFKSRHSFSKWLFLVHNQVQRDIFKNNDKDAPIYTDSDFDKVRNIYETFRAKCKVKQYGCTEPYNKNGKKRTFIIIKRFDKRYCSQKYAMKLTV